MMKREKKRKWIG